VNFTKEFSDIQSLWDVVDNAPEIQGYNSGIPFSPKSQDIQIQNISYGYNETKVFENFSLSIKR
jgi:ABC-type multidrug transport system fused ATPase/permease subunit